MLLMIITKLIILKLSVLLVQQYLLGVTMQPSDFNHFLHTLII